MACDDAAVKSSGFRVPGSEYRVSNIELRAPDYHPGALTSPSLSISLVSRERASDLVSRLSIFTICLFMPLFSLLLSAQAKYSGELFEFPGDARSVAMGGAGVSSTHEAATGFYNPALVGWSQQPSLTLAHREQFGGVVSADLAAINFQRVPGLAVQVGVVHRGVDNIPDTRSALNDQDGDGQLDSNERLILENISYFNQREWGILLSVARKIQTGWHWGINAKIVGHWLARELGLGLGFDLGLWRSFKEPLAFGIMLQDVTTTQVYWSTGRWETTSPRLTAGLRLNSMLPIVNWVVTAEGELTTRLDGQRLEYCFELGQISILSRAGIELALNDNLRLRIGSATLYPFTLGAGLSFDAFCLDYAYVGNTRSQIFEPTHQISLNLYLEILQSFLETG